MPRSVLAVTATIALVALTVIGGDTSRAPAPPGPAQEPGFALVARDLSYLPGLAMDVYVPVGLVPTDPSDDALPVAVLAHGCCGDRTDLVKLAETVASRGAVVMNVDWGGSVDGRRVGDGLDAISCAVRFGRSLAVGYGGDPRRLVLVGWSDGAMLAAAVALAPDRPPSLACGSITGSGRPDAVVGLAGFYGWELPVGPSYVTPEAERFVGGSPDDAPELWRDATPYAWLTPPVARPVTVVVGADDPLRADGERFATAVQRAGGRARLVVVPPAGEPSLLSPRTAEGQTAATEILTAARAVPADRR